MKTIIAKLPHGWFPGKMKETDIIDTIESSIGRWDVVIVELADTNEITQRERERVLIKNNSADKEYIEAYDGDGIDLGLNRANHRGTVKHGISHTIKTECDCGVIEIGNSGV